MMSSTPPFNIGTLAKVIIYVNVPLWGSFIIIWDVWFQHRDVKDGVGVARTRFLW